MFDYYNLMYKIYNKHLKRMYNARGNIHVEIQYKHQMWYELHGVLAVAVIDNAVSADEYENMNAIRWYMYEIVEMRYCTN